MTLAKSSARQSVFTRMTLERGDAWRLLRNQNPLPLHACRATFGKGLDFRQRRHGHVTRKSRQQCAMRPPQSQRLLGVAAVEQSVDQSRGKAIAASDAIQHVQLASRANKLLALIPEDRPPFVPVGGMDFAERRGDDFDIGKPLDDLIDHGEEAGRIQF